MFPLDCNLLCRKSFYRCKCAIKHVYKRSSLGDQTFTCDLMTFRSEGDEPRKTLRIDPDRQGSSMFFLRPPVGPSKRYENSLPVTGARGAAHPALFYQVRSAWPDTKLGRRFLYVLFIGPTLDHLAPTWEWCILLVTRKPMPRRVQAGSKGHGQVREISTSLKDVRRPHLRSSSSPTPITRPSSPPKKKELCLTTP